MAKMNVLALASEVCAFVCRSSFVVWYCVVLRFFLSWSKDSMMSSGDEIIASALASS